MEPKAPVDYMKIVRIVGMAKAEELREAGVRMTANPKPLRNLFGRIARHEQYGDVIILGNEVTPDGRIAVRSIDSPHSQDVSVFDLTFPEEATQPEDVRVGDAWQVDLSNPETPNREGSSDEFVTTLLQNISNRDLAVAVKIHDGHDGSPAEWSVRGTTVPESQITLVSPLVPASSYRPSAD